MRKPILGSVVSSLIFALGCNESSSPTAVHTSDDGDSSKGSCDHAPEVLFDPETGRITIVSDELNAALREHLDLGDDEGGTSSATVVFHPRVRKLGDEIGLSAADDHGEVNIGC